MSTKEREVNNMSYTVSFANFKGGVGKTSTTALVGYNMAKMGKKVLMVDLDAQANLTALMIKTSSENESIKTIEKSLMYGIIENVPPKTLLININPNLDIIPNAVDFSMYQRYLETNFKNEDDRISFLKKYLTEIKNDYDYVFLDVPPTLSLLNDTAFFACDQIVIVLQTQERSLTGAETFLQYLQKTLIDSFHAQCDVLGVLPVLSKRDGKVDEEILRLATEEFGKEYIFVSHVSIMERIKRMDMTGITDNKKDVHDVRVHEAYSNVAKELIERLGQ